MLVKEIVYMCLDLLKQNSDDAFYTEEHLIFLLQKYRAFLIKKEQDKEKSTTDIASEFEYQQICLDLQKVAAMDGHPCTGGYYLRTKQIIPKMLEGSQPRVYPIDFYQGTNISYVARDRMKYVGSNPYLQNIIYSSLGPDLHLYLYSSNPQFMYLKQIRMNAIFEDFTEANGLICDNSGQPAVCDILDVEFPIRDYLVPALIELVVKELQPNIVLKEDDINNAKDNIPEVNRRA